MQTPGVRLKGGTDRLGKHTSAPCVSPVLRAATTAGIALGAVRAAVPPTNGVRHPPCSCPGRTRIITGRLRFSSAGHRARQTVRSATMPSEIRGDKDVGKRPSSDAVVACGPVLAARSAGVRPRSVNRKATEIRHFICNLNYKKQLLIAAFGALVRVVRRHSRRPPSIRRRREDSRPGMTGLLVRT